MALPGSSPEFGESRPDLFIVRPNLTVLKTAPPVYELKGIEFEDPPPVSHYISLRRPSVFDMGREIDLHNTINWRIEENQRDYANPIYGYQENITEPGQIPLPKLNILNEWWIDLPQDSSYAILEQYLWNPYNLSTAHLGRYHNGMTGGESRVVRAFKFEEEDGQKVLKKHDFVRDRRELAGVDSGYAVNLRSRGEIGGNSIKSMIGDYLFPVNKANFKSPDCKITGWTQGQYGKIAHIVYSA